MIATFRRAVAGLLAVPALASAQAPIVPLAEPPAAPAPAAGPAMPGGVPDAAPPAEDAPKPPDKYFVEGLLGNTAFGKRMADNGFRVYGWTAMSQGWSSARNTNFPRTLDDRANQFQLNQNYLVLEKTLDTEKKEFQLGGVANIILPGTDARYTVPRGLWDVQLRDNNGGTPRALPIDPFQVYLQAFLPNLGNTTVKIGRFATHCSYEVVQAVDNPFVSRSYMFQNNPFTHTGIWATTPLGDNWSMSHGLATGSDTFIDPANRLTYLGQLKWAPKDGKTTVAFNTVITDPSVDLKEAFTFYNYYGLLVTHKITDKLTYVLDAAYSHTQADGVQFPNGGTGFADWYGAAQYLSYAHTDTVTSTIRAELFNDTTGFRNGTSGLYTAVTYGVQWKPTPWLYLRPSVRYDHNVNAPFEGNRNLWGGGLECIVRW